MSTDIALPGSQELLTDAPLLRLAYDGVDGTPRVIPIGFYWNGTHVVICTATTSPKVRALAERPAVAITIDSGTTPADAKALLIRGVAELETVDGIPPEYISGARKVMPTEQVPFFEEAVAATYDQMVRITIDPTYAKFYDFGAGRMPGFLMKLVEDAQAKG